MPRIELSMSGRPKSTRVVGIDLGTTNSLVAYMTESGPQVIRDEQGNALVPSFITTRLKSVCWSARKRAGG